MKKTALIVRGGWDGHEPVQVSERFARMLEAAGIQTEIGEGTESFDDGERLRTFSLIVPCVTMSSITDGQCRNVCEAVGGGTGLAGCHGGMCDSFRQNVDWQFMTGAQWVAHPGGDGTPYRVNIRKNSSSPIISGLEDFDVSSEQYYIHVDPCINVLATTRFPVAGGYHAANGEVDVPVAFTKMWGKGRVFYNSLGHHNDVFDIPAAAELMKRGMLWAAGLIN